MGRGGEKRRGGRIRWQCAAIRQPEEDAVKCLVRCSSAARPTMARDSERTAGGGKEEQRRGMGRRRADRRDKKRRPEAVVLGALEGRGRVCVCVCVRVCACVCVRVLDFVCF